MSLQRVKELNKSHHCYTVSLDTVLYGDPQHAPIVSQGINDRFISFMYLDNVDNYAWFTGMEKSVRDDKRLNEDRIYRWLKKLDREGVAMIFEEIPFSFDLNYIKNGDPQEDTWKGIQLVVRLDPFRNFFDD